MRSGIIQGVGESVWVVARELIAPNHEYVREEEEQRNGLLLKGSFTLPQNLQKRRRRWRRRIRRVTLKIKTRLKK